MPSTRNYKKWSCTEDRQLIIHYNNSKSFKRVANKLSRTIDAVQARYVKKYIYPTYDDEYLTKNSHELADKYNMRHKDFVRYLKYVGVKCKPDLSNNQINMNPFILGTVTGITCAITSGIMAFITIYYFTSLTQII